MMLLQIQDGGSRSMFLIFSFILRMIGVVVCSGKARKLNRSEGGWGFFGFFMPIVAMIWVNCMKPHIEWEKKSDLQ